MGVKITVPVARVLAALLAEPDGEHYGLRLMQQTGLASGTLYPVLTRLQHAGWATARWEDLDPVEAGRPARRYYQLTAEGVTSATAVLAELRAGTTVTRSTAASTRARPAW
ncbi:PadR family transcriptional regulator [Micromonospora auratinigra]|uniref:Transcriptional regulator, PadR family n=1 Tax=Micromonospora auratinigra TaxID=261654 RepID=A0A1A8ZGX1_9ACTN|nr:PadR family transcriptional regulator [Micromonospora auratinigra]SBT43117.1 transcriptional regulator, PadR family [Micromonospora auratinigra]